MSYTGTLLVGAHHKNPALQAARDFVQISGIAGVGHLLMLAGGLAWKHLHGLVVILASVALTTGCVLGFLGEGDEFAAILSALIGGLSIAVGITYHSLGERR